MNSKTLRRFVVTPFALLFAGIGISFWIAPAGAARRFGLEAGDASGLVAVRADLGGLFVGLALLCLAGAWLQGRRTWLAAAAVVLLAIAAGRTIGWIAGGSAGAGFASLAVELAGSAALLASATERSGNRRGHRSSTLLARDNPDTPLIRSDEIQASRIDGGSTLFPKNRKEKPMNRFRFFTMILSVAMTIGSLGSARAGNVEVDYDQKADFSAFESWTWKLPPQRQATTPTDRRVRQALLEGFAERGYTTSDRGGADFLVDFHTAGGRALPLPASFVGRRLRGGSHPKGVLVVDVFDAATGALIWRGSVSDAVGSGPLRADAKAETAVRQLLQRFPPPEGSSPPESSSRAKDSSPPEGS